MGLLNVSMAVTIEGFVANGATPEDLDQLYLKSMASTQLPRPFHETGGAFDTYMYLITAVGSVHVPTFRAATRTGAIEFEQHQC